MPRARRLPLALAALAALAAAPAAAQPPADTLARVRPAAAPADVGTPEALVAALYDVISGPAAMERDWDRFRSLFLPDARLLWARRAPGGEERLAPHTVEDFVRIAAPVYRRGAGFWESDAGGRMDRFGNVAHVFTAYESRLAAPDGPVVARGVNSVQLVRAHGRWWIANLVWDTEREDNPIPAEYRQPWRRP